MAKKRASDGNGKALVIVESPTKTHTLARLLGSEYKIMASVGHVRDLPAKELGVDVERDFAPTYVDIKGKTKILNDLRKAAQAADVIYLAPDPDREGEAIAWHVAQAIDQPEEKLLRVTFDEITKRGVEQGMAHPRKIDLKLFESQQARRILDRLVGYKLSPLLWKKVQKGLSAGRVQSVAVRLVCEREAEIRAFKPEEYWTIDADVEGPAPPPFKASLDKIRGEKAKIATGEQARQILDAVGPGPLTVESVEKKDVRRHPAAPFITSTLQQEAARKLRLTAKRTMALAQRLYEGVEINGAATGLITYMRTDSTRIAGEAIAMARDYIRNNYAPEYLPDSPNVYKTKKAAQDAHEAIRPTDVSLTPASLEGKLDPDDLKLYELIWKRFVACQMASALFEQTRVESYPADKDYLFVATGQVQKFNGFLALYEEGVDDKENGEGRNLLPALKAGDALRILKIDGVQHFTQPPPRFTEATLVRELERLGIGRPSTYASIISVIQDKKYVLKDKGRFFPTELGEVTNSLLVENFPKILDAGFTAQMEENLDEVEEGKVDWHRLLHDFYGDFQSALALAARQMRSVKAEQTDIVCEKCGAPMLIRRGRNGKFLACSAFPKCRNARNLDNGAAGVVAAAVAQAAGAGVEGAGGAAAPGAPEVLANQTCPNCGQNLIVKMGRNGRFAACPGYPKCKHAEPIRIGVKCPRAGCAGELVERFSAKKNAVFYSCNQYPKCRTVVSDKPVANTTCEKCGHAFLVVDPKAETPTLKCPSKGCSFSRPVKP